jgi:hypothetical protein
METSLQRRPICQLVDGARIPENVKIARILIIYSVDFFEKWLIVATGNVPEGETN